MSHAKIIIGMLVSTVLLFMLIMIILNSKGCGSESIPADLTEESQLDKLVSKFKGLSFDTFDDYVASYDFVLNKIKLNDEGYTSPAALEAILLVDYYEEVKEQIISFCTDTPMDKVEYNKWRLESQELVIDLKDSGRLEADTLRDLTNTSFDLTRKARNLLANKSNIDVEFDMSTYTATISEIDAIKKDPYLSQNSLLISELNGAKSTLNIWKQDFEKYEAFLSKTKEYRLVNGCPSFASVHYTNLCQKVRLPNDFATLLDLSRGKIDQLKNDSNALSESSLTVLMAYDCDKLKMSNEPRCSKQFDDKSYYCKCESLQRAQKK